MIQAYINKLSTHTVTLYDCPSLADGCSQCVGTRMGSGFMCGWCQLTGTCEVTQECSNMPVIDMATSCPSPIINSFFPISGELIKCVCVCTSKPHPLRSDGGRDLHHSEGT